jgi:hypothetical protein
MKQIGILLIVGVFLVGFLIMYIQKRKPTPELPPPTGVPLMRYPDWRILPYDPYYAGPPVYDPFMLRTGLAPGSVISWSSRYKPDPYDIPG